MVLNSLLDVAHTCQNDDPWTDASLYSFLSDGVQIGFVPQSVWDAVQDCIKAVQAPLQCEGRTMTFAPTCSTKDARTEAINQVAQWLREQSRFPDPLDGWRNEQYGIYSLGPAQRPIIAFTLERSACALFGFATYGVHLTAYTPDHRIWVPKRAANKATWPGYYDNSVAGGITAGEMPFETMVRECEEEAGLDAALVRAHTHTAGVITYFYKTPLGWHQPEMQYIYDLALPSNDIQLAPSDGEAESFELMDKDTILQRMFAGEFKPNCTLVLLDFFIRHGWLTPENEEDYSAIAALLHTPLRVPTP